MSFPIFLILLCINSIFYVNGGIISTMAAQHNSNSWLYDGGRFLKYLWDDCSMIIKPLHNNNANHDHHKIINDTDNNETNNNNYYYKKIKKIIEPSTIECLKRKSLLALDRALDADVIPLVDNIEMVRYHETETVSTGDSNIYRGKPRSSSLPEVNIEDNMILEKNVTDWKTSVIMRLADVFRTHVVRINFNKSDDTSEFRSTNDYFSARRRRHRHMMPIMMFGTIAMGMLLIPMGFKFLAVLGGKALLLAKMALLLASIQGLKRIATSGVNYGLYTQYPGWHERHGRVEVSAPSSSVPYTYDAEPIYNRVPQADLQMTVGG